MLLDDRYISIVNKLLNHKSWNELIDIFDNLNLSLEEKVDFCLYVSLNNNVNFSPTVIYEFVPYIFNQLIIENPQQLLKTIIDIRIDDIINCFKNNNLIAKVIIQNNNIINLLSKTEKFKKSILEDNELLINYQTSYNLFKNLPVEYGYLISLYNVKSDIDLLNIHTLYKKYYSPILTDVQIQELINIQKEIDNENDIFELGLKYRIKEYMYFLYRINQDKNYYNMIKQLSIKSNIDLLKIIRFYIKYDNTKLLSDIINRGNINNNLKEKILYLSNNDKLVDDINIINTSLESLKKMSKIHNYNFKINIIGGPHSNTSNHLFEDGVNREVRRINVNGEIIKYEMNTLDNHEESVKKIYNDLKVDNYKNVPELSFEAIKILSSITIVIEFEMCIIYCPDEISKEQKESLIKLFTKINNKAIIGIIIYNKVNDLYYIVNNGNYLNSYEIIDYINNMNVVNEKNRTT